MPLFLDNMIILIENPKESTKKPNRANKWIQKSCKYKITQNTIVFLYTTGIESKKEIKKTVPFILASKSMQELKDHENYQQ